MAIWSEEEELRVKYELGKFAELLGERRGSGKAYQHVGAQIVAGRLRRSAGKLREVPGFEHLAGVDEVHQANLRLAKKLEVVGLPAGANAFFQRFF